MPVVQERLLYGKLTVVSTYRDVVTRHTMCECLCQCGARKSIRRHDLDAGKITTCGQGKCRRVHGARGTPTWWTWIAMRRRCNDPAHQDYKHYGGRGIKVCERWNDARKGYLAFIEDMGERPADRTLDRKDVNGMYEPENCRWATKVEQEFNKRRWTRVNARREAKKLEQQREMAYWDEQERLETEQ